MRELVSFLPGLIVGLGVAMLLLQWAPRAIRADEALERLGGGGRTGEIVPSGARLERLGAWLHLRMPSAPGFTPPLRELEITDTPVAKFYALKFQYAVLGFVGPVLVSVVLQLTGTFFPIPAIASPVVALIFWVVPDAQVRTEARAARREFTRFVAVYLELVAVALLGNTTADNALISAAQVSDSWVFRRIRREFRAADLTRTSKWSALESLGQTIEVPPLVEMASTMRLAEARVPLRELLHSACVKLRSEVATADKAAAELVTSRMDLPAILTLIPIICILIVPAILQLITI